MQVAFAASVVARVRFTISPMWQVGTGFRLVRSAATDPVHRPWLDQVRPRVSAAGLENGWLAALIPPSGFVADLLNPTPAGPAPTLQEELAAIAATPAHLVSRDVARLRETSARSARLRALDADPCASMARVVEEIDLFWRIALAPYWDRIRATLEADVFHRARHVAEYGVGHLLNDLHPLLSWEDDVLRLVRRRLSPPRDPDAPTGLFLLPCAFKGPGLATLLSADEPWQIAYRARAIGQLWERPAASGTAALAAVVGRARATLLAELQTPTTTSDLARRTGMSMSGVSQNLTALRAAGFVSANRAGRHVLYARTAIGDSLFSTMTPT